MIFSAQTSWVCSITSSGCIQEPTTCGVTYVEPACLCTPSTKTVAVHTLTVHRMPWFWYFVKQCRYLTPDGVRVGTSKSPYLTTISCLEACRSRV